MRRPRRPAGFTLLELLVAVSLALVLASVALAVTRNALDLWRRVRDEFSGGARIRPVFDLLERDLRGALRSSSPQRWLAVAVQSSPGTLRDDHGWWLEIPLHGCVKPATGLSLDAVPSADSSGTGAGIAGARFGLGGTWLRLFCLQSSGLPAAISYQLVRRPVAGVAGPDGGAAPRYLFFRSEAADTLVRGGDLAAGYDEELAAPGAADVLADNVVDFGVWFYVRDATSPDGLRRLFPRTDGDTAVFTVSGDGVVAAGDGAPEVADVMVRVLTDEGATLLADLENGRGRTRSASDEEWWKLVETHSTVFVRRFELPGTAQ